MLSVPPTLAGPLVAVEPAVKQADTGSQLCQQLLLIVATTTSTTNTISLRISVITVNTEISMSIVTYREAHLMQLWTWEQGD